jgi:hypothetical protein
MIAADSSNISDPVLMPEPCHVAADACVTRTENGDRAVRGPLGQPSGQVPVKLG